MLGTSKVFLFPGILIFSEHFSFPLFLTFRRLSNPYCRETGEGGLSLFSLSSILTSISDVFSQAKKMIGKEAPQELEIMQVSII
jgi:hypothetical protein